MHPVLRFASILVLLFSLSLLPQPARSQTPGPRPPALGTLYLGQGQMLESATPRQLTLGENAYQFSYQPGGLEIACVGEQRDGNALTLAVRLIGVQHGPLATLISDTFHVGEDGKAIEPGIPTFTLLAGWSGNGRYLVVQRSGFVTPENPVFKGDFHIVSRFTAVDVGVLPPRLMPVLLPASGTADADTVFWWSPKRTRMLFAAQGVFWDGERHYVADTFCCVYDPAQDRLTSVELSDGQFTVGWTDETHLLLKQTKGGTTRFFTDDLATGLQVKTPTPTKLPAGSGESEPAQNKSATSPTMPCLTLLDEPRLIADPQQVTSQRAHALWVRRTQGPKPQSAVPVGLTPGRDDPQGRWSPNGRQIAFLAHGDLFVTDLTTRQATMSEKLGAGEPLNCDEERILASANLKQIGSAIFQFVQDNDEKYPPSTGLAQSVMPYLKDASLFTLSGHPFIYHAPVDLAISRMASPATTVLGTMDLPCATITLYADGHVKDILKSGN